MIWVRSVTFWVTVKGDIERVWWTTLFRAFPRPEVERAQKKVTYEDLGKNEGMREGSGEKVLTFTVMNVPLIRVLIWGNLCASWWPWGWCKVSLNAPAFPSVPLCLHTFIHAISQPFFQGCYNSAFFLVFTYNFVSSYCLFVFSSEIFLFSPPRFICHSSNSINFFL